MQSLIVNLSLKKSGTSYVHNILRSAGFPAGVEKEYYIFPRDSKHFFGLVDEVLAGLDKENRIYLSASTKIRLNENDEKFLNQIFAAHPAHVQRFQFIKDDPARVIRESIERLRGLGSCYGKPIFFVSDPNFMLDLYYLSSICLKNQPDGGTLPISTIDKLQFFSVVREPVSLAVSLVGLHATENMVAFDKIDAGYLQNIADRCRFFVINRSLENIYGFKTKLFRFDKVVEDPPTFIAELDRTFSVGQPISEGVSEIENPNPGAGLTKPQVAELRLAFKGLLAEEMDAYAQIEH